MSLASAQSGFADLAGVTVRSWSPDWISLKIAPRLELKMRVVGFFRDHMATTLPAELCEQLSVAIDELLANAMEHGCKTEPRFEVELTYIRTNRTILFQLRDTGPGFCWSGLNHAAVNNPPEDPLRHVELRSQLGLRPGGFGIMLVRQIADELIYNEYGNEVLLVKYL